MSIRPTSTGGRYGTKVEKLATYRRPTSSSERTRCEPVYVCCMCDARPARSHLDVQIADYSKYLLLKDWTKMFNSKFYCYVKTLKKQKPCTEV